VVLLVVTAGRVVVVDRVPGSVVVGRVVEVDDEELDVDDVGAEVVVVDDDDVVVVACGRLSASVGTARASSAAAVSTAPAPRRVEASDTSGDLPPGGRRTGAD
jgi:hypothetical protein